ncbi:MAG: hypothetical protein M1829_002973 [Trizodia sp. TS-e1964]|nr:MAG: hypothetical protein M1829_002973 [Trizodia sp. TS-e1964]
MTSLVSKENTAATNFDVDYVLSFYKSEAEAQFRKLVQALAEVGLDTEVRNGGNLSLLLFLRIASEKHLVAIAYRSRLKDWLYGLRPSAPAQETQESLALEPLTEAERLRVICSLITNPTSEGGAGITPKSGQWKCVESIFPLHDHTFNKIWIKQLSTSYTLRADDLTVIRDRFGEKVGFYFAFLQSYFTFLIFPAAFGAAAYFLLDQYSSIYAIVNCLWCVTFVEYWKHQETDLSIRWGVHGVSKMETPRSGFKHESITRDPITGQDIKSFPIIKRIFRQLLQIPFAILASILLGSLIATCFGIEVFITEVYSGPFKSVLVGYVFKFNLDSLTIEKVYLPTGLLITFIPLISNLLTSFATSLTEYENYETTGSFDAAVTQKIFVLNFITSYLGIFLTAFVYVPFGSIIVPHLDVFGFTVRPFAEHEKQIQAPTVGFKINPNRLRNQVIYFVVTAQIVNLALEVIMPYLKRKGFNKFQEIKIQRAVKRGASNPNVGADDHPDEAAFLTRVRNEASLDIYDVTSDLREMVMQFGYLSLFSVVWPLTGVSFIINDWIELRGDAIKICVEMQRPAPARADTIGPWLDSLGFLTWLGSITSAALVFLFSGDGLGPEGTPHNIKGWGLLLTIFFSEHIYMLVRFGVRTALSKIDTPALQKQRGERFMVRKRYLEESLSQEAKLILADAPVGKEKINRASLEEEARQGSLHHSTPENRFWKRQLHWEETAKVGADLVNSTAPDQHKKDQ